MKPIGKSFISNVLNLVALFVPDFFDSKGAPVFVFRLKKQQYPAFIFLLRFFLLFIPFGIVTQLPFNKTEDD